MGGSYSHVNVQNIGFLYNGCQTPLNKTPGLISVTYVACEWQLCTYFPRIPVNHAVLGFGERALIKIL